MLLSSSEKFAIWWRNLNAADVVVGVVADDDVVAGVGAVIVVDVVVESFLTWLSNWLTDDDDDESYEFSFLMMSLENVSRVTIGDWHDFPSDVTTEDDSIGEWSTFITESIVEFTLLSLLTLQLCKLLNVSIITLPPPLAEVCVLPVVESVL